jgi:hypothetical protein
VRTALAFFAILIVYGLLIIGTSVLMPLRLFEILQAAAFLKFSLHSFFVWIARSPGAAPLHYLVQLPFAFASPNSRILLRLPSIVFALASAFSFFVLTTRVPLQQPILALLLFLVVPIHLAYATQARPYELGLFLLLLATLSFFSLLKQPGVNKALIYAILLTACLYTQPSCYLPAVGYLLFLLAMKTYRHALGYVLSATLLPLAAYFPYYLWAVAPRRPDWLTEQFPAYAVKSVGLQALMSIDPAGNPWFGIGLIGLLLTGLVGGAWSAMPSASRRKRAPSPPAPLVKRRAVVFCLAGGVIVTLAGETAVSGWTDLAFAPYQILWALPGLVIVFCAALDAFVRLPPMRNLSAVSPVLVVLTILLCIPGDVEYLRTEPNDMAKLTALVRPQLSGDACIVFVSQPLSRYLFEVFDPALDKYECQNFFHKRVVLAIQPFVKPEQEREAYIFFVGLDFEETHRDLLGGGKIITMDAQR